MYTVQTWKVIFDDQQFCNSSVQYNNGQDVYSFNTM